MNIMNLSVIVTNCRQLDDVINVEEENQLNIVQHQFQDFVYEPEQRMKAANFKQTIQKTLTLESAFDFETHLPGFAVKNSAASML